MKDYIGYRPPFVDAALGNVTPALIISCRSCERLTDGYNRTGGLCPPCHNQKIADAQYQRLVREAREREERENAV